MSFNAHKVSGRGSKRAFSGPTAKTRSINVMRAVPRGGIRL